MASSLELSDYELDDKVKLDIDFDLDNLPVGVFTMDITPEADTTMGEIRHELAEILKVAPDDITISFQKTILEDSLVIKDYLDDIKEMYQTMFLTLTIKESEEPKVAKVLEAKMLDVQKNMLTKTIVFESLNPNRETELTLYKGVFVTYLNKTFH